MTADERDLELRVLRCAEWWYEDHLAGSRALHDAVARLRAHREHEAAARVQERDDS